MAKANYRNWLTGETVTAAMLNEQIRDNGNELWVGTTPGDMEYYASSTSKTRIPKGTEDTILKIISGVPAFGSLVKARQGGNATQWDVSGTTNYTNLASTIIQCGKKAVTLSGGNGSMAITFPQAFSAQPLMFFQPLAGVPISFVNISWGAGSFTVNLVSSGYSGAADVIWLAIGPT